MTTPAPGLTPEYTVSEVLSRRDLREFIEFPDRLYKDCPQYVPALHSDQKHCLTASPSLKYCKRKMWLVRCGGKVVGRICGMINSRYNEIYNRRRARFGWFDTIEDFEVARLLLETAENWAREQGCNEIHGPLYYNTAGKQGMLVEGFEHTPQFNCIYNYPYYADFIARLGYEKELDWIQYRLRADQDVPEKLVRIADRLKEKYGLQEMNVDKLKKDKKLISDFFKLYNEAFFGKVQNFIPYTDEEIAEESAQTLPFVSNTLSNVYTGPDGDIASFSIILPSISRALQKARGHLFPFGWFHLLRALHNYETVDMMLIGAAPKWENTGITAVSHVSCQTKYRAVKVKWCISNPQIETNHAVDVWQRYEHELFMRRRCWIKTL